MKILLLVFVVFAFQISFAQKITLNEIDKFTKQRRIETSSEKFKNHIGGAVGVYLKSVDSNFYLVLTGFGSYADVLADKDKAIFLLDNDETVTVYSVGIQTYDVRSSKGPKGFTHLYRISESDVEKLAAHNLKSVRKYGVNGYQDIEIVEKKNDDLKKLAALLLKEYKKTT